VADIRRGPVSEQRKHREHAAVVVLGVLEPERLEDRLDVAFDRPRAEVELLGDRPVRAAFGDQRQHAELALAEVVEHRAAASRNEAADDARIECRSPGGDAFDGVDELGDVADAVLEQVAHAGRVAADELEQVRRLEVLRQDEHRHARMRAAYLRGGEQPVVGLPGRHADVDDRDVGLVRADL
jgi:hypothetical protein